MDSGAIEGLMSWRRSVFRIMTVMMEMGREMSFFAGTPASMSSVHGTVIQGLRICSDSGGK